MSAPRPTLDTLLMCPETAHKLPREILSDLLAQNAAVQSILVAALVTTSAAPAKTADLVDDEKWITPAEAAQIIRKDVKWIYRHAAKDANRRRTARNWEHASSALRAMLCSRSDLAPKKEAQPCMIDNEIRKPTQRDRNACDA
jgi:hypothetical protein